MQRLENHGRGEKKITKNYSFGKRFTPAMFWAIPFAVAGHMDQSADMYSGVMA
jgi:hypothetical protein